MKKILLFALMMSSGLNASAWISNEPTEKTYTFKYKYEGEVLEIRRPAGSYEEAFEKAADACFRHYKTLKGGRLSEDQGLDVIDTCANPRS